MDSTTLKHRTKAFGLTILQLLESIPNSVAGRAIAGQIVRSGTSVGANYRSACRGRSKAEFAAKIGIIIEEADETGYWLEMLNEGKLVSEDILAPLLKEANELVAIFTASQRTARENSKSTTR